MLTKMMDRLRQTVFIKAEVVQLQDGDFIILPESVSDEQFDTIVSGLPRNMNLGVIRASGVKILRLG